MTTAIQDAIRLERHVPGVGTIEFVQTPSKREYWLLPDGAERRRRMPSVTTILEATWPTSHQLKEWMKREGLNADARRDQAARRGTTIHKFIEKYLVEGDLVKFAEFPADHLPFFEATARFLWEHDPEMIASERLVCHPELQYAGRLDLIARLRSACSDSKCHCRSLIDVATLWDFKTSASGRVYSKAHAQTAAYMIADARCGSEDIERVAILGIGEDGHYEIVESIDEAKKLWGSVLDFHRTMQRFDRALGEKS